MADEVKQEVAEGKEAEAKPGMKLLSVPVIAVGLAVLVVAIGGVIMLSRPGKSRAKEPGAVEQQDPDAWRAEANKWRVWDLGTVWVARKADQVYGDRKISAKFSLVVSRSFLESLEAPLEELLRHQVKDLIMSVLESREQDIRKDPRSARLLLQEDILRGLKLGANPNDPEKRRYQFPFNDENLKEVYIEELQVTRW